MKIYRVVATIEDACGENKEIDFIHETATLDGAYRYVTTWIRAQLKPGFCLTNDTTDSVVASYTIKPINGPDYFCSCWIEEEVLYDYDEKERNPF